MDEANVDALRDRISKLSIIVRDVEQSEAWRFAMDEISSLITELDQNWQALTPEGFREAQISKTGLLAVTTLVPSWKDELEQLEADLFAVEHPDQIQSGDYDTETTIGE